MSYPVLPKSFRCVFFNQSSRVEVHLSRPGKQVDSRGCCTRTRLGLTMRRSTWKSTSSTLTQATWVNRSCSSITSKCMTVMVSSTINTISFFNCTLYSFSVNHDLKAFRHFRQQQIGWTGVGEIFNTLAWWGNYPWSTIQLPKRLNTNSHRPITTQNPAVLLQRQRFLLMKNWKIWLTQYLTGENDHHQILEEI